VFVQNNRRSDKCGLACLFTSVILLASDATLYLVSGLLACCFRLFGLLEEKNIFVAKEISALIR